MEISRGVFCLFLSFGIVDAKVMRNVDVNVLSAVLGGEVVKMPKSKYEQTKVSDEPLIKEMSSVQDFFNS